MTDFLILFSGCIAGGVRCLAGLCLICRLLSAKKPEKRGMAVAFMGAVLLMAVFSVTGLPALYLRISEVGLLAACSCRFQKTDMRMSLFVGIFYEIAAVFWQFLLGAWLGVLFRSTAFLDGETGYGQIAVWCFHLLLLIFVRYLVRPEKTDGKTAFRIVSAFVVAGFVAVITLSEQRVLPIAEDTLDLWTILAVVLMMAVLVFHMNRQYEVERELAKLKAEQAELLEREYTTLNNAYAAHAKLFHDLHNHIGVLRRFLSQGRMKEALGYLDELQAPIKEMTDAVWTGDETVDYLINSKAAIAEENGIEYRVQVEFPHHTNLKSADLCAIVGNLLDNALDAAKQVPDSGQRVIRLTIRRINQMLLIKVENPFLTPPVEKEGVLKTSKEGNGLHGWGLKSAMAAAEKYDGTVRTSCADHIFRAVATLSYQSASIEL